MYQPLDLNKFFGQNIIKDIRQNFDQYSNYNMDQNLDQNLDNDSD